MNRGSYVLAGCLLGGCFSDPADVPSTYTVGGTVAGMWEGASVTLHLEAGDLSEDLSIGADGTFVFDTLVPEQTAFEVTVATQPDGHACAVDGASMVLDANIDDLAITCAGPAVDVAFSAPITWTFDVDTLAYDLDVSTLISETAVTITSPDATALRLDGADLTTATPSAPVVLALGANTLTLDVEVGSGHRTFTLAIDRGAAEIEQYAIGTALNADVGDSLGVAIAISGDTVVVGAPLEDGSSTQVNGPDNDSAQDAGAVYVFRRVGSTWTQEAYVKPPNTGSLDSFGTSVAIDGDTLVVGAPSEDGPSNADNDYGAAYIFVRTGTTWLHEQTLRPAAPAGFGASVAIDDDVLAVGAIGITGNGAAYVYHRGPADWGLQDTVQASAAGTNNGFGRVALRGNLLVVGAWGEASADVGVGADPGDNTAADAGAAYIYRRTGTAWSETDYLKASNTAAGAGFGHGTAISTDGVVIGSPDSANGGSFYIFR